MITDALFKAETEDTTGAKICTFFVFSCLCPYKRLMWLWLESHHNRLAVRGGVVAIRSSQARPLLVWLHLTLYGRSVNVSVR